MWQRIEDAQASYEQCRAHACGAGAWEMLPPPEVFAQGAYLVGHTLEDAPYALTDEDLNGPLTLIVGPPNSGKSLLLERIMHHANERGILVIGVDTKNPLGYEPRHGLPILKQTEIAFGCDPCPGASTEEFDGLQTSLLEQSLYLHSGSRYILEAIKDLRRSCGAGEQPCLRQVLDELIERAGAAKPWAKGTAHLESGVNALQRLCGSTKLFSGRVPLAWERRLTHSHVLSLRGQPAEAMRVAVLLYPGAFLSYAAMRGWTQRQLRALFCLDDARVVARAVHREGQAAVDALTHFTDVAHASGGGVVLVVQHLAEVAASLVASANVLILVGPIAAEDLRALKGRLQLNPEREDYLLHQPAYHAVVHVRSHAWPLPVPVRLAAPDHALGIHEASARRAQARRALFAGSEIVLYSEQSCEQTANAVARPAPAARGPVVTPAPPAHNPTLEPKLHRLVVAILDRPYLIQSELGTLAGIEGRELTALREQLEQMGLVAAHRMLRYCLWEALPAAAARVGREFAPLPGRGGFAHRFWQARWAAWKRLTCPRVEIEFEIPGVGPVDGFAQAADGARQAVEIVLSMETAARALDKLAAFQGERAIIVADGKAAQEVAGLIPDLRGVAVLTLAELVKITGEALVTSGSI